LRPLKPGLRCVTRLAALAIVAARLGGYQFMVEELTEVQKLRRKLRDAVGALTRHVEAHPESKSSPEHLRLVMKCQELERQLDRLAHGDR
jgi:hypothetical protein